MIVLVTINHDYTYELSDIIKMYFGKEEILYFKQEALENNQSFFEAGQKLIVCSLDLEDDKAKCSAEITYEDKKAYHSEEGAIETSGSEKQLKRLIKKTLYKLLSKVYNKSFPWGILSGIRPLKIVHEFIDKGITHGQIKNALIKDYLIENSRAELSLQIAGIEREYLMQNTPDKVSIYVGIPFCPSRCYYCSFTSNSMVNCSKYVEPYLDILIKEICEVALFIQQKSIKVETVYIGGGTPTTLSAKQLNTLINCINQSFGGSYKEFTCEAGRPDTITEDKLAVLRNNGVSRISINPQTMNDETLHKIGRAHNASQVVDSYKLARRAGFDNINMDIILGLPDENISQLKNTLTRIKDLDPESITVHTMAIKRASILNESNRTELLNNSSAEEMMNYTMDFMKYNQMLPYYLYRQKHMVQNLENIGYCRKGYECIYNIQIIEEKQTNIAFGADSVTKIIIPEKNAIERQHNIKDLRLYIDNVNSLIQKKIQLLRQLWV